jgi:hypothetical protein
VNSKEGKDIDELTDSIKKTTADRKAEIVSKASRESEERVIRMIKSYAGNIS